MVFRAVVMFKRGLKRSEHMRTTNLSPELTAEQMEESQTYWYQEIQKTSFAEEWCPLQKKEGLPSNSPLRTKFLF